GDLAQGAPVAYQTTASGSTAALRSAYVLQGGKQVGITLTGYDPALPLVIDPTLGWSTYVGGADSASASGIAVDSSGDTFVVGSASSKDFPTQSPAQSTNAGGSNDVVVFEMNSTGTKLLYSTYLGGKQDDEGDAIAVDSSGSAYVTGL